MSDHNKKGWYHSDLMKALKPNGTILMMLKTDPMESNYKAKNPKALNYCVFAWEDAQGEQSEHTLNVEPELEDTIRGMPKDVWLTCRVEGGKNVAPSLTAEDEAGPVFVDPANAQPARQNAPHVNHTLPQAESSYVDSDRIALARYLFFMEGLSVAGRPVDTAASVPTLNTLIIQMKR